MPYNLPCPHCKLDVDYKAHVCPNCTQPINTGYQDAGGMKTFLIGAVIGLLFIPICGIFNQGYTDPIKSNALKNMYFGDIWWMGWIMMPVGAGALISWIWAAAKRRNA